MRVRWLLLLVLITVPLFAVEPKPKNLGFEDGAAGWTFQKADNYLSAVVTEPHSGASSVKLWSVAEKPAMFIPVLQAVDATPYRGKFVRLRMWIRTEVKSPDAGGHVFMRVDRPNRAMGFFNNTMDRPVRNPEWGSYEIVGDVAPDAEVLVFGGFFHGSGAMWMDDASVEIADDDLLKLPEPSQAAAQYLEKAIAIIEKNALRRDSVDWATVRERATMLAHGGTTPADTYASIRYVLRMLDDHHSFFMPAAAAKQWSSDAAQPRPDLKLIEENVGYVSVPGFMGGNRDAIKQYAAEVQAQIAKIDPSAKCGWIVDLRKNTGGNMWPMLSGLGPIVGEGRLMSMAGPATPPSDVVYAGGIAVDSSAARGAKAEWTVYAPECPPVVAVLTSKMTASSGEAVTIAFRGRPHTRSFGTPTAGLTTGNQNFNLDDGAMIFLTTTVMSDRTGTVYGGPVKPDVEVSGEAETMSAALNWLRAESGCVK